MLLMVIFARYTWLLAEYLEAKSNFCAYVQSLVIPASHAIWIKRLRDIAETLMGLFLETHMHLDAFGSLKANL